MCRSVFEYFMRGQINWHSTKTIHRSRRKLEKPFVFFIRTIFHGIKLTESVNVSRIRRVYRSAQEKKNKTEKSSLFYGK